MIAANTIHAAAESGVTKLLYLGSSCIYPRMAPQPIEARLKHSRWISEAVLIGDHRPYVVALLVPNLANLEAHGRAGADVDQSNYRRKRAQNRRERKRIEKVFDDHLIAFDNRGVGETDKPAGPYTAQMLADDTAGLGVGFEKRGDVVDGIGGLPFAIRHVRTNRKPEWDQHVRAERQRDDP